MNDDTLDRRLGALRRSVEPEKNLWPRIEARLDAADRGAAARIRRRPGAPAWAALAAAACLAGAALVLVPRILAPADPLNASRAVLRRELRDAEREYAAARDRLISSLRATTDGYGQETVARIEGDLRSVDRLVAEVRATAGDDDVGWQPMYRLVRLYRSQTAGIARADELVRSVSLREEQQ